MAKYIANENGDWWEHKGDPLYVLDTDNLKDLSVKVLIEEEVNSDKFDRVIREYGYPLQLPLEGS